ncbi:MAG: hypothetical protein LBB48_04600 [Treponema sp.]|nr:hypothetical protein [Treponema sp.]
MKNISVPCIAECRRRLKNWVLILICIQSESVNTDSLFISLDFIGVDGVLILSSLEVIAKKERMRESVLRSLSVRKVQPATASRKTTRRSFH